MPTVFFWLKTQNLKYTRKFLESKKSIVLQKKELPLEKASFLNNLIFYTFSILLSLLKNTLKSLGSKNYFLINFQQFWKVVIFKRPFLVHFITPKICVEKLLCQKESIELTNQSRQISIFLRNIRKGKHFFLNWVSLNVPIVFRCK